MLNCIEWEIIYWKYIQSKSCKIRRQIFGRRRYTNIKAKYGEEVEYRNIKAKYREAAQIISESPAALQLRYLQVSLSTLFSETFSMSLSFSSLYVKFWWPLFLALKFTFLFLKLAKIQICIPKNAKCSSDALTMGQYDPPVKIYRQVRFWCDVLM